LIRRTLSSLFILAVVVTAAVWWFSYRVSPAGTSVGCSQRIDLGPHCFEVLAWKGMLLLSYDRCPICPYTRGSHGASCIWPGRGQGNRWEGTTAHDLGFGPFRWRVWEKTPPGDIYRHLDRNLVPVPSTRMVWSIHSIRSPLWGPLLLFVTYPTLMLLFGPVRRSRPRRRGLCVKCGYDLRGLPRPRCPECGTRY